VDVSTDQPAEVAGRLDAHRNELTGYCYRMLGSGFDAEDAVQETMLRAWRNFARFEADRAPLRSWLYRIATNVCLDMLRGAQRRARAMDLGPAAFAGAPLGAPLPETAFVQPIPDSRVLFGTDPAELAAQRDTIRLAFVAALQYLPPKQRAVLILRDVLCWEAAAVGELLDCSVAAANSALQRARATMAEHKIQTGQPVQSVDKAHRELLSRYVTAFADYDVRTLVSLLHEDATMSMPPFSWWLRGREQIRTVLLAAGNPCEGARLVSTSANGSPALAQYRPSAQSGGYEPFALMVLDLAEGSITGTTTYLDATRLFPLFDLPLAIDLD
jgi:RNA polymerase sigma-70 factor (ECF subfamily)